MNDPDAIYKWIGSIVDEKDKRIAELERQLAEAREQVRWRDYDEEIPSLRQLHEGVDTFDTKDRCYWRPRNPPQDTTDD